MALKGGTPREKMTLKIETVSDGQSTTIRLIGRVQAEHVEELKAQIKDGGPNVTFDLYEVGLVDVEAVRFLGVCEAKGVQIVHCSPYIRNWISKEQDGRRAHDLPA
jgi:anti-anti-sigma regulatory factor